MIYCTWEEAKEAVAAQTLSYSVASGMRYLKSVGLVKSSDHTSQFVENIRNIFDILNSKSKFGRNLKAPISLETRTY